jgi:cytochrome c553
MADVPALAGQTWRYLYIQLRDFKEGRRSNPLMSPMAQPLSRDGHDQHRQLLRAQPLKPQAFKVDEARRAWARPRRTRRSAPCAT